MSDRPKTHSERIAAWLVSAAVPAACVTTARNLLLDVAGLCVAARGQDYVLATRGALDPGGACTALGHTGGWSAFDAALLNGTAAHGEDYDDTFEGGPVHSGAVLVPALLAIAERDGLSGAAVVRGLVLGSEILCRLSLVAPKAIHKAGFHPTAVIGAISAAAAVGTALNLPAGQIAHAIGIAGSMASGIIEYLADGSWTKRMHAGWAAQSGIRAALMAKGGFIGPLSVLEGTHGFFRAFAPSVTPDYTKLFDGLGETWVTPTIAFKPYACGTMTQPFIDCGIALRASGIAATDIADIVCDVGEGTVHRLWDPLSLKHSPPTPTPPSSAPRSASPSATWMAAPGWASSLKTASAIPTSSPSAARSATASIPTTNTRAISPAICAPPCMTAACTNSASRICAAAPATRLFRPRSKPSSTTIAASAAGTTVPPPPCMPA